MNTVFKAYSDKLEANFTQSLTASQRRTIVSAFSTLLDPPELSEEELAGWKQDCWGGDVCPVSQVLIPSWGTVAFICRFTYKSKMPLFYLAERLRAKLIVLNLEAGNILDIVTYYSSCKDWSFTLQLSREGKILLDQELIGKAA